MKAQKMNSIVCTKYGSPDVLKLKQVDIPQPKENEILVKIHATSATSGDARIRRADPFIIRLIFGFTKPRNSILGVVVAGEVVAKGTAVTKFKIGDQIFGTTGMNFGAYAEYTTLAEDGIIAFMPDQLSYEEAAAIPFGATAALHFLRKAKVQSGQKVLIYGASGALGTAAVQISKEMEAEVTAVCSGRNIPLVKKLGADMAIDYTKEEFVNSDKKYDVIFETVGKSSISQCLKALKSNGTLAMASAGFIQMLKGLFISIFSSNKVIFGVVEENAEVMHFLNQLIKDGKLKPVIDRTYPLEKASEAHRYVDTGRKIGNVILINE